MKASLVMKFDVESVKQFDEFLEALKNALPLGPVQEVCLMDAVILEQVNRP